MKIPFAKMHGLGNDFVVLDATTQPLNLHAQHIRAIAHRRLGIGCDQVLIVEPSLWPDADFGYRIFNADGGEVAQCGNGARCFARFVTDKGLTHKKIIPVRTANGRMELQVLPDGQVRVNMGEPIFTPDKIPFISDGQHLRYEIQVDDQIVLIGALSMGNPHAIVWVNEVAQAPLETLGAKLERHPRFPQRTNVGFAQIMDAHHLRLRVFERGVGETQACGSNACAAVAASIRLGLVEKEVTVSLPGGDLAIIWEGIGHPLWMTGPATHVFEGTWML